MSDTDLAEQLERAQNAPSTTPPEERNRCPVCGSVNVDPKNEHGNAAKADWYCRACEVHFDEPTTGAASADEVRPDYETVRAARAKSGRWHLTGEHGCYNQAQVRTDARRAVDVSSDKRNREWCFYCEQTLEILRLKAEIQRLEAGQS